MVTLYTNSKRLWVGLIFLISFERVIRHKRIGYNLNVVRQSACLVINPITVDNFVALFNCSPMDRALDYLKLFILVGRDRSSFVCCLVHRGSTDDLLLLQISSGVAWKSRDL